MSGLRMDSKRQQTRNTVLYRTPHRYRHWRRVSDVLVAALIILAPPLLGWLRFDLWGGEHRYMGEAVTFTAALKAFVVPFFVINAVILLVTHQLGRYLCGWVCPTGVIIRWAEEIEYKMRAWPIARRALVAAIAFVVATGGMIWWVDLRVYTQGTWQSAGIAAAAHLGLTGLIYFEMQVLRFGFCHSLCPSGVYFAVLGQLSRTGITEITREENNCIDCGVCATVCPVDIEPRDMLKPAGEAPGIYFDGMSTLSRCIRCGDCVTACDVIYQKTGAPGVLEMGFNEDFEFPVEDSEPSPAKTREPASMDV